MNPATEQLRPLCRVGFRGERLFNHDGGLALVHYTREHRNLREAVLVYSEGAALAYRTRDLLDLDSPLHISENSVEWRVHGDVVTVVNALLSLTAPGPPDVPSQLCADDRITPDRPARNAPEQPAPPAEG
ncbi:MAG: hypothetical protein ACRDSH_12995 [Pseudonocardiaceae bacterium]